MQAFAHFKLLPFFAVVLFALAVPHVAAEIRLRDDAGREISLPGPARRIVSLAPHITEILFAAGAGQHVVGAVAHSDYPPAARTIPQVGSHAQLDMEAIVALAPDLVIGWASGSRMVQLGRFDALGIPVYLDEPGDFEGIAQTIETFGVLAGTESASAAVARDMREQSAALARRFRDRPPIAVFYQLWESPLMTVNGEHLISRVIDLCGGQNVFADLNREVPTVGVESVLVADPEVIVMSAPAARRDAWREQWRRWPQLRASAEDNLYSIPPDLIQRPTPRVLEGAAMLCDHLEAARAKRPTAP